MKRRELALGLAVLSAVSTLCLRGMRRVGRAIEARTRREEAGRYRRTKEAEEKT